MKSLWKNIQINLMYWRFRHITRNRLRFQNWLRRRRPALPGTAGRPRGTATYVYRRTGRRTWIALLVMVVLLTALGVAGQRLNLGGGLIWALSLLVVVGGVYWALRGL